MTSEDNDAVSNSAGKRGISCTKAVRSGVRWNGSERKRVHLDPWWNLHRSRGSQKFSAGDGESH